jgi:hypothetical protein
VRQATIGGCFGEPIEEEKKKRAAGAFFFCRLALIPFNDRLLCAIVGSLQPGCNLCHLISSKKGCNAGKPWRLGLLAAP